MSNLYRDQVVADGASNYWRLGEPSGTVAADQVGGKPGTISGGVTLGQPGAIFDGNTAMTFNGTTGKIETATNVTVPLACTVEAWIVGGAGGNLPVVSLFDPSANLVFYTSSARLAVYDQFNGSQNVADAAGVPSGWHHVVWVLDGATVKFYIDGVLSSSVSLPRTVPGVGHLTIGWTSYAGLYWTGPIDEVAVYPSALTPAQIANHFDLAQRGGIHPTPTIFVPYHAFDDLVLLGTRAAQPLATTVTPGTLYCVSNEGSKVERSSGTAWEAFSPNAAAGLPANIAYTDVANIFTKDQTIQTASYPQFVAWSTGDNTKMSMSAGSAGTASFVQATNPYLIVSAEGGGYLGLKCGAYYLYFLPGVFYPGTDNVHGLGQAANRWTAGYFAQAVNIGTNPAASGALRLANGGAIMARNAGNTGDLGLAKLEADNSVALADPAAAYVWVKAAGPVYLSAGATTYAASPLAIQPNTDDVGSLGTSAQRFSAAYLKTAVVVGDNPATTGAVRLANTGAIMARNAANTADVELLKLNAANAVLLGGTDISAALALKAPLASPALTGVPTAPTATAGTNTTQLATTAFATGAVAALTSAQIATAINGQLGFPATQVPSSNPNTLDDYEEAPWTPVIGGTGGQTGQTYTVQDGSYTIVGRLVVARCRAQLSNKGTITGSVQISGLPVPADSGANAFNAVYVGLWAALQTPIMTISGYVAPGASVITLLITTAAAVTNNSGLVAADLTNTTQFIVTAIYFKA